MSRKIILQKEIADYLAKYFLIEEKSTESGKLFGVEIELFDGDILKSHESIKKITQSSEIILQIIKLLADKNVTPNSLLYVIDEIFDMVQNSSN